MSDAMETAKAELAAKCSAKTASHIEAPASLSSAFLAMQAELPTIPKTREGFNFRYAPYEAIAAKVYPVLHKHGFFVRHFAQVIGGEAEIVTEIVHASTEGVLRSSLPFDAKSKDQDRGKSLTYGKRYNLVLLLGLNIEGEPDADDAQPNGGKASRAATSTNDF